MTKHEAVKHLENMKWLKGYDNTQVGGEPLGDIIDKIIDLIWESPEVTYCQNCKYYQYNERQNEYWCYRLVGKDLSPIACYYPNMGYCSYGERRKSE